VTSSYLQDAATSRPWRTEEPTTESATVVCHNDFAPYNCVYSRETREPYAIIDFDHAEAGTRAWDLAYALYRFVPLCSAEHGSALGAPVLNVCARTRIFLEAYGEYAGARVDTETVIRRLTVLIQYTTSAAQVAGSVNATRIGDEGHVQRYLDDLAFLETEAPQLASAFTD
jgi:Ser/Thr protein kinase RdoA (MazF antagonist)